MYRYNGYRNYSTDSIFNFFSAVLNARKNPKSDSSRENYKKIKLMIRFLKKGSPEKQNSSFSAAITRKYERQSKQFSLKVRRLRVLYDIFQVRYSDLIEGPKVIFSQEIVRKRLQGFPKDYYLTQKMSQRTRRHFIVQIIVCSIVQYKQNYICAFQLLKNQDFDFLEISS